MQSSTRLALALMATAVGCGGDAPADPANQADAPTAQTSADTQADAPPTASDEGGATVEKPEETTAPQQADAPGLAVGAEAPEFELPDQHGESRTLAGLLRDGPVALVFYRSADW